MGSGGRIPVAAEGSKACGLLDRAGMKSHSLDRSHYAPHLLTREQILQVADIVQPSGAAVEKVVNKADDDSVALRHESMHRFRSVEESSPGGPGDLLRQCGRPFAAVEGVVAVPERAPSRVVGGLDLPNGTSGLGHHDVAIDQAGT